MSSSSSLTKLKSPGLKPGLKSEKKREKSEAELKAEKVMRSPAVKPLVMMKPKRRDAGGAQSPNMKELEKQTSQEKQLEVRLRKDTVDRIFDRKR